MTRKAQSALDLTLVDPGNAMAPADLALAVHIDRGIRVQIDSMADALVHLFLHDQHDRGQVPNLLSGTSVTPPTTGRVLHR